MAEPPDQDWSRHPPPDIAECLQCSSELWIFGYGSLMWDPGFAYGEAQPGRLRGYHRSFCIYSRRYRGTPERPGLVLGLEPGGACDGIAYRVPAADADAALRYIWQREMTNHTYRLSELLVATSQGAIRARALVADRRHPNYAGGLSLDETARYILQGMGTRGSCRDYLENTLAELRKLGVTDGRLHRLEQKVRELTAHETPCGVWERP
jgi:glutathione-specific gamma-glutamylcyclotransferase